VEKVNNEQRTQLEIIKADAKKYKGLAKESKAAANQTGALANEL
jgi:hypothetical protein